MSKVENINDLVLKELKNEILDAIDEAEHSIKKLDNGHPSIYMCLAEIDAYKRVIDMIDRHKEKHEYRPYSFMYELPFNKVGDVIKIRNKNQELITYTVVNSVSVDKDNKVLHIIIGTTPGTTRYWFDTIEVCVNDKWQPFGVLDE